MPEPGRTGGSEPLSADSASPKKAPTPAMKKLPAIAAALGEKAKGAALLQQVSAAFTAAAVAHPG